jgi:hypothetical protein
VRPPVLTATSAPTTKCLLQAKERYFEGGNSSVAASLMRDQSVSFYVVMT